jgi:hypothetical protein
MDIKVSNGYEIYTRIIITIIYIKIFDKLYGPK